MQRATGLALALVLALLALASVAEAWGPLSHYYFAVQAFPTADPFSVKQGCDLPDGFYFANWSQFPDCSVPVDAMHNGVFPGYLVQFALTPEAAKFKRGGFDPLSMALAFGSHVYADVVGFHTPFGGYLGPTVPNYATTWPLMTAIDAHVSHFVSFDPDSTMSSEVAAEFVAAGTEYAHRANAKYGVYNATAIKKCSDNWGTAGLGLIKVAKLQAASSYYQQALIAYDQFNATTFQQTAHHFSLANDCAVALIQHWAQLVWVDELQPETAFAQSYAFSKSLFAKGACTPYPVS